MSNSSATVVRALDLGWGYTKYSFANRETGQLEFGTFPSLAPRAASIDMSDSAFGQRDTVVVDVDGTSFEVGPDAADLDINDASRNLNDQFINTEQYRAVFFGALHYIGEPVIDLLVVGLPLSNMGAAARLKSMMLGKHRINENTTVEVKEALVLPQPLGGLHYCLTLGSNDERLANMREEVNLIVDPGFLTFDFLLASGEKVVPNRSGAHNAGVSKVLRSVADSISAKHGIKYDNLAAIDRGLRVRKMKINGEVEALEEHIKNTRSVLEAAVNYMKNKVGDGSDIDNIILLGGGSAIFRKTIKDFFPKHNLIIIEDAQFANVRGFQIAGQKHADRSAGAAQSASPPSDPSTAGVVAAAVSEAGTD